MIIGVTGPSGAGKSTLSSFLKEKGFYILDADLIVDELYKTNKDLINIINKEFPFAFLEGKLNKKILANFVFSNSDELEKLGAICNPFVLKILEERIKKYSKFNIAIDAITLIESKASLFCEKIIAVVAKKDRRLERIVKRDNVSFDMALNRFCCQKEDSFYIERSDFLIENDYCYNSLKEKTEKILIELSLL